MRHTHTNRMTTSIISCKTNVNQCVLPHCKLPMTSRDYITDCKKFFYGSDSADCFLLHLPRSEDVSERLKELICLRPR